MRVGGSCEEVLKKTAQPYELIYLDVRLAFIRLVSRSTAGNPHREEASKVSDWRTARLQQ